ncbi:MAG: hypothetical protein Q4A72_07255 [Bacillota bacterium]|nr:hypothetical protein [Bacillota bacterium]
MENKITILGNPFRLEEDSYVGRLTIWGRETDVFIETEGGEECEKFIRSRIDWLNANRDEIITPFMEENDHMVEIVNEMIAKGDFKADAPITEQEFEDALLVRYLSIIERGEETEFTLDLDAEPDYLLGHLGYMEIDSEYEVEFSGMNG